MSIDPKTIHPIRLPNGEIWPHTIFLKNVIKHPNIIVGDFTYYNDFRKNIIDYSELIAPYLHAGAPEKLIIGKFCQIAHGVQFITSSSQHQMDGISTFPFAIFGGKWSEVYQAKFPNKGDTVVGNDVWLGHDSIILPGVTIGDGAIIAARSVVTRNVAAYTLVAGNPARIIRKRFSDQTIAALIELAWWDWPQNLIEENIKYIVGNDIERLQAVKQQNTFVS
jgi:virginiamycin A acetyltransferase